MVSYIERGQPLSYSESKELVTAKDEKSRQVMLHNWGFDIFADRTPFGIILDATDLIPEISTQCAQVGADLLYKAALHALTILWAEDHHLELPRTANAGILNRLILRTRL
jgi:hypothetical protein